MRLPLVTPALLLSIFVCGAVLTAGCGPPEFPGIGITIKNDIQDADFNTIDIQASGGGRGYWKKLKPGERLNISGPGAATIKFTRRYQKFTRHYTVECPKRDSRISIKLIDVHVNRIAGGCATTGYSES